MSVESKIDHAIMALSTILMEMKTIQEKLPHYRRVRIGDAYICSAMDCVENSQESLRRLAHHLEDHQERSGDD